MRIRTVAAFAALVLGLVTTGCGDDSTSSRPESAIATCEPIPNGAPCCDQDYEPPGELDCPLGTRLNITCYGLDDIAPDCPDSGIAAVRCLAVAPGVDGGPYVEYLMDGRIHRYGIGSGRQIECDPLTGHITEIKVRVPGADYCFEACYAERSGAPVSCVEDVGDRYCPGFDPSH